MDSSRPLRNHDLIRKKSEEMKKLVMIENELANSEELCSV